MFDGAFKNAIQWFRDRQLPNSSSKIKWSNHDQNHFYKRDSETPPALKPVRRLSNYRRKTFSNPLEAVSSNRRHVRDDVLRHYASILPRLRHFGFHVMSLEEMETNQHDLINELDNLREVDPDTGFVCTSDAYKALEDKLLLLLEASDCLAQKANIEKQLSCTYDDSAESNRVCLIFSIESKRVARRQKGSFHLCVHSKNDSKTLGKGSQGYILCT